MSTPTPPIERLEAALHRLGEQGLQDSFAPPGLADRALARSARRRRRTSTFAVAGAAVAAVLVVLTVVLIPHPGPKATPPALGTSDGVFAQPRQNVLLLGTDAGPGRVGARPDTIILASIDTATGETTMIGLPRNLEGVPFPAGTAGATAWPQGFSCAAHACLLNSVWQWAETSGSRYFPGDRHAGLTATAQAVEGITGLHVDQTAVIKMSGLEELVDVVGGVTVTVQGRLPVGGTAESRTPRSWLEPGRQKLDGYHALWYARSRWSTDDRSRMERQQCLVSALVQQTDAKKLFSLYPRLTAVADGNVRLSIPADQFGQWGVLARRVARARMVMLPLHPADPASPDFGRIRQQVDRAITPATASPASSAEPRPSAETRC